jgi:hypothetical protein
VVFVNQKEGIVEGVNQKEEIAIRMSQKEESEGIETVTCKFFVSSFVSSFFLREKF